METLNGYICINALFCYNDVKNSDPLSLRIFSYSALWITHTHTHESIFSLHSNFTASQEPRLFYCGKKKKKTKIELELGVIVKITKWSEYATITN